MHLLVAPNPFLKHLEKSQHFFNCYLVLTFLLFFVQAPRTGTVPSRDRPLVQARDPTRETGTWLAFVENAASSTVPVLWAQPEGRTLSARVVFRVEVMWGVVTRRVTPYHIMDSHLSSSHHQPA